MTNLNCVLDACTIINIFCIDDDKGFLFRKLIDQINTNISCKVISEVRANYKKRINLNRQQKEVNKKIGKLYSKVISNRHLESECGTDYFDTVSGKSKYNTLNGEFYSVSLSLYLSQINECKVYFITDDLPAKHEFNPFYWFNQIGSIEDTSDLLLLLYRLDENFSARKLNDFLDQLYSEYAMSSTQLLDGLRKVFSLINTDRKYRKKTNLKSNLSKLIAQLSEHNFDNIFELKEKIESENNQNLNFLFKNFIEIFYLSTSKSQYSYLKKIRDIQKKLKTNMSYRILE